MRKLIWISTLLFAGMFTGSAFAQNSAINGYCSLGATSAVVSGLSSTNKLQGIISRCTVTVYQTGTFTLATIFSNSTGTPLGNGFTATTSGQWLFFAAKGCYDVVLSAGFSPNTYAAPVTLTDLCIGGAGAGTVSSVGLSLPSDVYAVAGSPVTGSGTLAATLINQGQNTVWASPCGSGGPPSFRGLCAADIPAGSTNYIQTSSTGGQTANLGGGGILAINSAGTPFALANTTAAGGGQLGAMQGNCPGLIAGPRSGCALAVGVSGAVRNFGALYFRYQGSGSSSNYMQMSVAVSGGAGNGICTDANGFSAINNVIDNPCGDGSHTLLVNGSVASTTNTLTAAAPTVSAGQFGIGATTAAASNCNNGGTLTLVKKCWVVTDSTGPLYLPLF